MCIRDRLIHSNESTCSQNVNVADYQLTMSIVCVQPPPSAVNATLPALAHLAAERRCSHCARSCRSVSSARRALSSKPAGRRCCRRSMGQKDTRTDVQPLYRSCSACVNNNNSPHIATPYKSIHRIRHYACTNVHVPI